MDWTRILAADPTGPLRKSPSLPVRFFTTRDLVGADAGSVEELWEEAQPVRLARAQQANGSWRYPGGNLRLRSSENYDQLETYRNLRILVEQYGMNRLHPAFKKAAEYFLTKQTDEGDIRGICGNQYVPYYSAAIVELLVKGGYADDKRIEKSYRWLLSMRQEDGGWAFPLRTAGMTLSPETFKARAIEPDRSKPFSHLVTGVILRAFAAHRSFKESEAALQAGRLLVSRFFKPDKYPDRRAPNFWTCFSYPFWFTDLLSAMDSVTSIGLGQDNPNVSEALDWFVKRQGTDGLWRLPLRAMARVQVPDHWVSLAVCRVVKRLAR